jgi:hypothetical protein
MLKSSALLKNIAAIICAFVWARQRTLGGSWFHNYYDTVYPAARCTMPFRISRGKTYARHLRYERLNRSNTFARSASGSDTELRKRHSRGPSDEVGSESSRKLLKRKRAAMHNPRSVLRPAWTSRQRQEPSVPPIDCAWPRLYAGLRPQDGVSYHQVNNSSHIENGRLRRGITINASIIEERLRIT